VKLLSLINEQIIADSVTVQISVKPV